MGVWMKLVIDLNHLDFLRERYGNEIIFESILDYACSTAVMMQKLFLFFTGASTVFHCAKVFDTSTALYYNLNAILTYLVFLRQPNYNIPGIILK